jgi:large subunit ribosomal protein L3
MNRPGLIGRKVGMTQVYDENGNVLPVTVLEVGPCPIIRIKTSGIDGYDALKIGYQESKKGLTKPMKTVFEKAGVKPQKYIKEFRCDTGEYKVGQNLTLDIFEKVEYVDVTGITKGKGFQGVMKRWGFHGGRKTHGSMFHRRAGAVGQCQWPGRIIKGKKMPGRMGGKKKTVQNLQVIDVDTAKNVILVKGAVPGPNNGIIYLKEAVKKPTLAAK